MVFMKKIFENSTAIKTLNLSDFEEYYKTQFAYSIVDYANDYHSGLKSFTLNRCLNTGTLFFTPRSFTGDQSYYESITSSADYYKTERWEWTEALNHLKKSNTALEIGCGNLSFMKMARDHGVKIDGVELSSHAKSDEFCVFNETVESYAQNNPEKKYDAIVSFHVLEHVADVDSFLDASKNLLKKGGVLILALPNNDSFIAKDPMAVMNMPPHHVNWWTPASIVKTLLLKNMSVQTVTETPLASECYLWYCQTHYNRLKNNFGFCGRVLYRIVRPLTLFMLRTKLLKPKAAEMLVIAKNVSP